MTTFGPAFTEDEYKTRTYEELSSEFQKLYPQAVTLADVFKEPECNPPSKIKVESQT